MWSYPQHLTQSDYRMARAFAEHFISSYIKPPKAIVIDLDHMPAIIYGGQQMSLFNGKYNDDCYLPLMIFEGLSGKLITAILRPGKTPTGQQFPQKAQTRYYHDLTGYS